MTTLKASCERKGSAMQSQNVTNEYINKLMIKNILNDGRTSDPQQLLPLDELEEVNALSHSDPPNGNDLTGDDLTGDDLTGDDLTGDDLTGDDLTGDDLTGDDLTGDDLTEDYSSSNPGQQLQSAPATFLSISQINSKSAFAPGGRRKYSFDLKRRLLRQLNTLLCDNELDPREKGVRIFTITVNPKSNPDPEALYDRIKGERLFKQLFRKLHIKDYFFVIHFNANGFFHFHFIIPQKALPCGSYHKNTHDFKFDKYAKRGQGYMYRRHHFDKIRCDAFLKKHDIGDVTWISPRTTTLKGAEEIVKYLLRVLFDDNAPIPLWVLDRSDVRFYSATQGFGALSSDPWKSSERTSSDASSRTGRTRAPSRTNAEIAADNGLKVMVAYRDFATETVQDSIKIWGYLPAVIKYFKVVVREKTSSTNSHKKYSTYCFDSKEEFDRCRRYHEQPAKIREFQVLRARKLRAIRERAKGNPFAIGSPFPMDDGRMSEPIYSPGINELAIYSDLEKKSE